MYRKVTAISLYKKCYLLRYIVRKLVILVPTGSFEIPLHLSDKPGSRKFCQRGSNFENVFFFLSLMGGGMIQIPLLSGHHWPAPAKLGVSLACRLWPNIECWLGSFTVLRASGPVLLKKTYIFVIFQVGGGGGPDPCPLSGSGHVRYG